MYVDTLTKARSENYPLLVTAVSQVYTDYLNRSKNKISYAETAPSAISLEALKAHLKAGFDEMPSACPRLPAAG